MSTDRDKYSVVLDTLTDALGRSEGQSIEDLSKDLQDEGIDVVAALKRLKMAQQNISMAARRSALDAAREKRLELLRKGNEFVGKFKDWSKSQILERIKELSGPEVGLAFRDLDALGLEEMASILEDLEMAHYRKTMGKDGNGE
jgi:DNA-binding MarR family transcriptional regulator